MHEKIKPGFYEIKPEKYTKLPTVTYPKKQPDDMYYTYTTKDYNNSGEEVFQIHIHEPETLLGKIKHKVATFIGLH